MLLEADKRGQGGFSLLLVLGFVLVATIVVVAIGSYAQTSLKANDAYQAVKNDRYAGDGAIKAATNWIKDQPGLAVDPDYPYGSSAPCRYDFVAIGQVEGDHVTVSCDTQPGSGSGVPAEQGALPPESLLLLGQRHHEPGPYSYSQCASLWDDFVDFFTNDTPGSSETSLRMEKARRSSGFGFLSCQPRNRGNGPIQVQGEVVAGGKITSADGLTMAAYNGDGTVRAQYGCAPAWPSFTCGSWQATRNDPGMPWNGTPSDSDPGRASPITVDPIGNIRPEFLPIGFDADGSLRDGYVLPTRTTAYVYDPNANTSGNAASEIPKYLTPVAQCTDVPAGTTIMFLPGWYRDSEVLSRYMSNPSCPDRTFWFTPRADFSAEGAKELLAPDNETGAFYMDFTNTAGRGCGEMTAAVPARWCMGGSAADAAQGSVNNSKPRVVVGWPKNWEPFPAGTASAPGGSPSGTEVSVVLDQADSIEGNFLTYWSNRNNAKTINGDYATYSPCSIDLWFSVLSCPTFGQRTLRIADVGPKVTGGPLAQPGAPNGRIYLEVAYGLENASNLNTPQVVVDALDTDGVAKACGTFTLTKTGLDFNGSGPLPSTHKYTFTDTQAKALADSCGAVELINNLRVTFQAGGNPFNNNLPKIHLDGIKISYTSFNGASFPVGTDGSYTSQEPAKSDCDETKPGGQLIFGGESHAYVADGSLEVCGGPDPDNPAQAMVTGIYGVPAVDTIRPTSVAVDAASPGSNATQLVDANNAKRIGEPNGSGAATATIKYPGKCYGFIGIGPCDPVDGGAKDVVATMPGFAPASADYRVKRVEARASYSAEGPFLGFTAGNDGAKLKAGACTENARTTNSELRHWTNEGSDTANKLVLYEYGTSRNCIPPGTLSSGAQVRWKTNVPGGWGVVFGGRCFVIIGSCDYTQEDKLEGVELDVTIEPTNSSVPFLRPQSGCITAHPNYTGGEASPDCAVVRADSFSSADDREGSNLRGTWVGRMSVKGTIYAPSSAIEIDDNDIAYPLATRGAILRHLRIGGAKSRANFTDPMFGGDIDDIPAARSTVLTACVQSAARRTAGDVCDPAQDDVLTEAAVRFLVTDTGTQADVPVIDWWSDRRTGES